MAIENIPMFSAMNKEEVKPPFPRPNRPLTSQEAHFAIMEKVNACINEVNQFEQRVRAEMERFFDSTTTENTAFKEAIQASYNAFLETVQREVNNFETNVTNNYDLFRADIDTRIANFQETINNDFARLTEEFTTLFNQQKEEAEKEFENLSSEIAEERAEFVSKADSKIAELEEIRVTMLQNFTDYKNTLLEIVENFKTQVTTYVTEHMAEQDGKIEEYKDYMVTNILDSTRTIFNQKMANGEIAEIMQDVYGGERVFKGSLTYDEITAVSNPANGDTYYCTTDEHYYQYTETGWADVGNGDRMYSDYEAYKINNDIALKNTNTIVNKAFVNTIASGETIEFEKTFNTFIKRDGSIATVNTNDNRLYITNNISVTPSECLLINSYWEAGESCNGFAFYDANGVMVYSCGGYEGENISGSSTVRYITTHRAVIVPTNASYLIVCGSPRYNEAKIIRNPSIIYDDGRISSYAEIYKNSNLLTTENVELGELIADTIITPSGVESTLTNESLLNRFSTTDYIEIDYKAIYTFEGSSQSNNLVCALYDGSKNFVRGWASAATSSPTNISDIIIADNVIKYVRLAQRLNSAPIALKKVTGLNYIEPITPKEWEGVTWVAVGDSITEHNESATKNYVDIIVDKTGITAINNGRSGSGYARRATSNPDQYTQYGAYYDRMSTLANVDFDVITFYGSGNDMGAGLEIGEVTDTGTETLCGCINTTLDNLTAVKPLAKIGIITPVPWRNRMPSDTHDMKTYVEKIVEIAEMRSIPVLNLYKCSTLNPNNDEHNLAFFKRESATEGDGIHPNADGHARIAPIIQEFMRTLIQ